MGHKKRISKKGVVSFLLFFYPISHRVYNMILLLDVPQNQKHIPHRDIFEMKDQTNDNFHILTEKELIIWA
jgi:hypothetical protein